MAHDLRILYQDEHYVAVDKPAGVLVHRSSIDRGASNIAMHLVRDAIGRHVYPVHRLDKPTSGVLVFGVSPEAARRAVVLFTGRETGKRYTAVVRGYVDEEGEIDYPLKEVRDKKADRRARADKPAQPAVTRFRLRAQTELPFPVGRYQTCRYSLVDVYPQTGRQHQIRRHMKHIFHPILGDRKYGDWRHNRFLLDHFGCERMLLHAAELSFIHPFSGQQLVIGAPLDEAYLETVHAMFDQPILP